jgi:hypothetical protein
LIRISIYQYYTNGHVFQPIWNALQAVELEDSVSVTAGISVR